MAEFSQQYGDKFADGSRTLAYSKVTEPVMVNRFDTLDQDVDKLKNDINILGGSINSLDAKFEDKIDNLGNETAKAINDLRSTVNTDMRILNAHIHSDDVKLNTILITIYTILQVWPLRFLNKIFHWWTFDIVNEERSIDGKTYIFYVKIILKNQMSRADMIRYNKAFSRRIKTIKSSYTNRNIYDIRYCVIPSF